MTEHYPYGPLTREDFERLSMSFYDESQTARQRIATQRGVRSGEYIKLELSEIMARGKAGQEAEEPTPKTLEEMTNEELIRARSILELRRDELSPIGAYSHEEYEELLSLDTEIARIEATLANRAQ